MTMRLNKGSIETMVVEVVDELGLVSALPLGARYSIFDTDDNPEQANLVPTIDGMTALCVIDSTLLDKDDYNLYLTFTASPDTPRLGPYRFRVQ